MTPERRSAIVALVAPLTLVLGVTVAAACGDDGPSRQEEVARRGAEVMPFDLDATTHRFDPTGSGLVETVTADDPADDENIASIRRHLADEARRFAGGDYRDPATIHGHDMPGLAELEAGAARIDVGYGDRPAGGRITYTTTDPALVDALHAWGTAQTMDHGSHARAEHDTT